MDPIGRVAERRRKPSTCLYCTAPANSNEHIVPEAVGGRLKARILCVTHNNALSPIDKAFSDHYATLTFGTSAERQRGKTGTSLRFIDGEGREARVNPTGRSEYGLHSVERNEAGVVQRAAGALGALEAIAKGHPDPNGFRLFEIVGPGVTIPIEVGIVVEVLPGFLKTSLHFAAGFVKEPSPATIAALRPGIFGERPVRTLMQLPFRSPYFDPVGAIRHEVTIYPDGEDAIVTIMLFSAFCVTMSLPGYGTRSALRYVQLLDGTGPQLLNVDAIPIPRTPLSDREMDGIFACTKANLQRIFADRQQRDIEDICQNAAKVALGFAFVHGLHTFPEYFRAELQRLPLLDADRVKDLVRQARAHLAAGRMPFDESLILLS